MMDLVIGLVVGSLCSAVTATVIVRQEDNVNGEPLI